MSHLHLNNKWQCIGFKDQGNSHPRIEISYGQKCHICGGDEQGENNISSKIKYNYKRIFLLSVTIIGFLGILGLLQFCNSGDRKEKSLYESAIDAAINNNVPEAIDKLCKLPESSQYWEQVKAEEQINYLTKASIGYGIEKRVGKRQK